LDNTKYTKTTTVTEYATESDKVFSCKWVKLTEM
jgi:hypothetical protein